jgi:hypothetical protein
MVELFNIYNNVLLKIAVMLHVLSVEVLYVYMYIYVYIYEYI